MTRLRGALDARAVARAVRVLGWEGSEVEVARSFAARLRGLIARGPLGPGGRLLVMAFPGCRSVHTCGMAYPLDIAFVDGSGAVLALHRAVPPWRTCAHPCAVAVLERAAAAPPSRR